MIPESLNREDLIAPLDYDLAFRRKEFLNIDYKSEKYGTNDEALFEEYMDQVKYLFLSFLIKQN